MNDKKKYKAALEKAKKFYAICKKCGAKDTVNFLENTFLELKVSEEEMIRKWLEELIEAMPDNSIEFKELKRIDVLHWLEKQGEQHSPIDINKMVDEFAHTEVKGYGIPCMIEVDAYRKGIEDTLEKQSGQKHNDEVKSKFHPGDWVTNGMCTFKIASIEDGYYYDTNNCGTDIESIDKAFHLWTVQDAKEGDVLFQDLMGGFTFIYNGVNSDMALLYSFIISNDGEDVLPYHIGKPNTGIGYIEENKYITYPATKEQRSLLFTRIKEAGYEWDAENKKLKKIKLKKLDAN